jgi:branched-chain amino acid transport system permease protein
MTPTTAGSGWGAVSRTLLPYVALLVALLVVARLQILGAYGTYFAALVLVYAIAALGLNVALGFVRLLNVAQAGLMGISAYTVAVLTQKGMAFPLAMLSGMALACTVGALVGALAARVRSHYFLIVTIGVQQAAVTVFQQWTTVTGGSLGLRVDAITIGGVNLALRTNVLMIAAVFFVLALYAAERLRYSRPGRAMIGLGQSETAAQSLGISAPKYNVIAMAIAGLYAGVAGALFVPLVLFIAPESFAISLSILLIAMVVIGGLGSNIGTVLGVVLLSVINEQTSSLPGGIAPLGYGLVIMVLVVVAPGGLANVGRRLRSRLPARRRPAEPEISRTAPVVPTAGELAGKAGRP